MDQTTMEYLATLRSVADPSDRRDELLTVRLSAIDDAEAVCLAVEAARKLVVYRVCCVKGIGLEPESARQHLRSIRAADLSLC